METIVNAFSIAFGAIFTNKTRTFLTMLGVIIGVASVILLTAIGNGLQNYITEQFNQFGANNVYVVPGDPFGGGGGFNRENQLSAFSNNKLRMRDVRAIESLREHISGATPLYQNSAEASFLQKKKQVTIIGTNDKYSAISNTKTYKGRFLTQAEYLSDANVAVLGFKIADELFGKIDPVGKKITIGTQTFRIVGVAEEKGGGFGGPSFDTYVFIPIGVAFKMFNAEAVTEIIVQTRSREAIQPAIGDIKKELGKRLDEKDFTAFDQKEILQTINQILGALTAGLGGIAAISLVVGGIGILNIMLVSVIERTREIGLRKALGATPNVILMQFLIEAATLSVLGGLIGTGIAYLITLAINSFIPAKVTPDAVLLAFGVSALIGIVFGVIPARRASQLSPIEALRYE